MAEKKVKTPKFPSLTTPGARQDVSNYLVELAFLRENKGFPLPPKFWNEVKYKFRYKREIQACRRFIKTYGYEAILKIAKENYITTWTDFAQIEVMCQKIIAAQERLLLPKDKSAPTKDFTQTKEDYRGTVNIQPKKGLFDRLSELDNG